MISLWKLHTKTNGERQTQEKSLLSVFACCVNLSPWIEFLYALAVSSSRSKCPSCLLSWRGSRVSVVCCRLWRKRKRNATRRRCTLLQTFHNKSNYNALTTTSNVRLGLISSFRNTQVRLEQKKQMELRQRIHTKLDKLKVRSYVY